MQILLILQINDEISQNLIDKEFKKEKLFSINNEAFAYVGSTKTSLYQTRAFLFDLIQKTFILLNIKQAKFIFKYANLKEEIYNFCNENITQII